MIKSTRDGQTIKAVIYARFSPRPNSDECDSVEKQIEDGREYCERQGWEVVGCFDDKAMSGADHERVGIWDAINALKRGYVLVVRACDRLARETMDYLIMEDMIERKGARLAILESGGLQDDSPVAQFTREVLAAVAKLQRLSGNARTKGRMISHQRNGRRMSSKEKTPYGKVAGETYVAGHDKEGRAIKHHELLDDPHERFVIDTRIVPLFHAGLGLREICRVLEDSEIWYREHRHWNHGSLRTILEREGLIAPLKRKRRRKISVRVG